MDELSTWINEWMAEWLASQLKGWLNDWIKSNIPWINQSMNQWSNSNPQNQIKYYHRTSNQIKNTTNQIKADNIASKQNRIRSTAASTSKSSQIKTRMQPKASQIKARVNQTQIKDQLTWRRNALGLHQSPYPARPLSESRWYIPTDDIAEAFKRRRGSELGHCRSL